MYRVNHLNMTWIVKHVSRFSGVNYMSFKWKEFPYPICLCCHIPGTKENTKTPTAMYFSFKNKTIEWVEEVVMKMRNIETKPILDSTLILYIKVYQGPQEVKECALTSHVIYPGYQRSGFDNMGQHNTRENIMDMAITTTTLLHQNRVYMENLWSGWYNSKKTL